MIVDLFIPCFIDQFYPETAKNMIKVLEKVGCAINYNSEQTCCGQPAFNAGYWDDCKEVGEKNLRELNNDRYIVSPSASCVGFVKNYYPEIFHNSVLHNDCKQVQKNMFEISDFLVNILKITSICATLNSKAVYMDSCCAVNECNIKDEPRILLKKVNGLELIEMNNADECCGFGGTFSIKNEAISIAMAEQKIDNALATQAEYIISTDYSCLMHLNSYIKKNNKPIKVIHIVDVLASGWQ